MFQKREMSSTVIKRSKERVEMTKSLFLEWYKDYFKLKSLQAERK